MLNHSTTATALRFGRTTLTCLILGVLLYVACVAFNSFAIPQWQRGEYGGDLRLLKTYYSAPKPGESNHIIDMLRNGSFREFLKIYGLTNNNALFVLSHGRAINASSATRYAFYPDEQVLTTARVPYFSARDLAKIMGPREASKIRNVILAGCNVEGAFDAAEIRKYFVNVTNITHTPSGKNGYEYVYRHGLMYTSDNIKFLYQMPSSFTPGKTEEIPVVQNKSKLSPYISELFHPDILKPYQIQVAGRELLGATPFQPTAPPSSNMSAALLPSDEHIRQSAPAKPIIMIGSGLKGNTLDNSSAVQTDVQVPNPFGFLGVWRDTILNGLIALVFLRIGMQCFVLRTE
jgi:hypothetical protein